MAIQSLQSEEGIELSAVEHSEINKVIEDEILSVSYLDKTQNDNIPIDVETTSEKR